MTLSPPLDTCSKIFMLHMNFHSRAREHGDRPAFPVYHLKPPSTLTTGGTPIYLPPGVQTMLGEAEIALVVGRVARYLTEAEALNAVSHVAAANDVTIFDYGWSDAPSLVRSKGFDSFTPLGELVPLGRIDPGALSLRLWVNGVLRQEAHSSDLIFSFSRLVAELSSITTLNPGDVILTGTPAGAPALSAGDEVIVDLGGVSRTVNRVVADPRAPSALLPEPRITPRGRAVAQGSACHRRSAAALTDLERLSTVSINDVQKISALVDAGARPLRLVGDRPDFVGHAFTLRQVPANSPDAESDWPATATAVLSSLRAVGPGEVIVTEGGLSESSYRDLSARVSERSAAALACEDPPDRHVRFLPVATNAPIAVKGITVMPGDVILSIDGRALLLAGETVDKIIEAL